MNFILRHSPKKKKKKKSILRICVPSTLCVIAQHIEILTVRLDLTSDISKQLTFHNRSDSLFSPN